MSSPEQQASTTSQTQAEPSSSSAAATPSVNIDPRLYHNGHLITDEARAAALHIVYERHLGRHISSEGYPPEVQALLKDLPSSAVPPTLARDGYTYTDGDQPGGSDGDGGDSSMYQLTDADGTSRGVGGRKKRPENNGEDWTRIRKDNHKEVERRRRGTINQGINELSALMPTGGSSDKAKGAILSRAVTYIRQLKENETRNIEKWTLEKLLMDQAMGELQATIEETRRRWEEERAKTQALETEVAELRAQLAGGDSSSKRSRVE